MSYNIKTLTKNAKSLELNLKTRKQIRQICLKKPKSLPCQNFSKDVDIKQFLL